MSDERDIYSDEQRIADFDYMWEHACSLLFSNDDVYVRPIAKAHRVVRKVVSEWHEEPIRYLYAPATKVRRRLEVQGYTREKCIELWEREYARHIGHLEKLRGVDDDFNAQIDAQRGLTYEEWEAWQTKEAQLRER